MADGQWYWCLKHQAVEPYEGCKSEDRLGPYATREEAAQALERVQQRNDQWDREDEDFGDDADSPSPIGG